MFLAYFVISDGISHIEHVWVTSQNLRCLMQFKSKLMHTIITVIQIPNIFSHWYMFGEHMERQGLSEPKTWKH